MKSRESLDGPIYFFIGFELFLIVSNMVLVGFLNVFVGPVACFLLKMVRGGVDGRKAASSFLVNSFF